MPAAAVNDDGQDTVRPGSTSAISGQLRMSNRFIQAVHVPRVRLHLLDVHHLQAGRDELNPDRVGQPGRLHTRIGDQHDLAHA
jgi:hypothetical protein